MVYTTSEKDVVISAEAMNLAHAVGQVLEQKLVRAAVQHVKTTGTGVVQPADIEAAAVTTLALAALVGSLRNDIDGREEVKRAA